MIWVNVNLNKHLSSLSFNVGKQKYSRPLEERMTIYQLGSKCLFIYKSTYRSREGWVQRRHGVQLPVQILSKIKCIRTDIPQGDTVQANRTSKVIDETYSRWDTIFI